MAIATAAPWHKRSYDAFLQEKLPKLLAERLPMAAYSAAPAGPYAARVIVEIAPKGQGITFELSVPQPDDAGVFEIDGRRWVVPPMAENEKLDSAAVACVGEQLHAFIESRLGQAPADLVWDQNLARTWLPLESWVREFILTAGQVLDETNWLSRIEHLRRIRVREVGDVYDPGQIGRTCPYETPEGPNIGKLLHVAVGADIRDGRIVIADSRPEAGIGVAASVVPFIEHNDPNRQLMGVNMARQWIAPTDPEPALVRTGNEPTDASFWCGRNLLTAFIAWGIDTHEDALTVSESAAARLNMGGKLEAGDKLSNRHGSKGTIARILPDSEMPHLPDGRAVELIFSVSGLHTRMNFGQVREAVAGRIAEAKGRPMIAPSFAAPKADELQRQLAELGMDTSGQVTLTAGKTGKELDLPSTVGVVYWGKLVHRSADKLSFGVRPGEPAMMQGEFEFLALRDIGAAQTIGEQFNTRSVRRDDAATLAHRLAAGPVEQGPAPSPHFANLVSRLAAAGIRADFDGSRVAFSFAPPAGPVLRLARPVPHPWMSSREVSEIGMLPNSPACNALARSNDRLNLLQSQDAPASMIDSAAKQLQADAQAFFAWLLTPADTRANSRILFSGKAVISPGRDLRPDQVSLPDAVAWALFGPQLAREVGEEAVRSRTPAAQKALDALMSRSWVIINRTPTLMPTSLIALQPVRAAESVIRLPVVSLMYMNADFDGDQVAVFLPITEAGQREAAEKLTVAAHLARDSSLLRWVLPPLNSMWGLAYLWRKPGGRRRIEQMIGHAVDASDALLTKAALEKAVRQVLTGAGASAALDLCEKLMRLGFDAGDASGASLAPFAGSWVKLPPKPDSDDPAVWSVYAEEVLAALSAIEQFEGPDLGPQFLAIQSGARGNLRQLRVLLAGYCTVTGPDRRPAVTRHSLFEGISATEMPLIAAGGRRGIAHADFNMFRAAYGVTPPARSTGWGVIARALRSETPALVFARAAERGEVDPLSDLDARLFVGLCS